MRIGTLVRPKHKEGQKALGLLLGERMREFNGHFYSRGLLILWLFDWKGIKNSRPVLIYESINGIEEVPS
jgi:hypothetical protein